MNSPQSELVSVQEPAEECELNAIDPELNVSAPDLESSSCFASLNAIDPILSVSPPGLESTEFVSSMNAVHSKLNVSSQELESSDCIAYLDVNVKADLVEEKKPEQHTAPTVYYTSKLTTKGYLKYIQKRWRRNIRKLKYLLMLNSENGVLNTVPIYLDEPAGNYAENTNRKSTKNIENNKYHLIKKGEPYAENYTPYPIQQKQNSVENTSPKKWYRRDVVAQKASQEWRGSQQFSYFSDAQQLADPNRCLISITVPSKQETPVFVYNEINSQNLSSILYEPMAIGSEIRLIKKICEHLSTNSNLSYWLHQVPVKNPGKSEFLYNYLWRPYMINSPDFPLNAYGYNEHTLYATTLLLSEEISLPNLNITWPIRNPAGVCQKLLQPVRCDSFSNFLSQLLQEQTESKPFVGSANFIYPWIYTNNVGLGPAHCPPYFNNRTL